MMEPSFFIPEVNPLNKTAFPCIGLLKFLSATGVISQGLTEKVAKARILDAACLLTVAKFPAYS